MARIAILYCKRIQDHSCIACAKCFKGIAEKNAQFAQHDTIELVAMTDCGDCPGLTVPRVKLLSEITKSLGREIETIKLPDRPANLAFGGLDGRTLYMTARGSVYKVTVRFPGATFRAATGD